MGVPTASMRPYVDDPATRFGQIAGDVFLVAFGVFMLYGLFLS
jgi:hypothetical protein